MTNLMPENPISTNGASADGASDAALSALAPNPNIGSVRPANIVDEMQTAYLDYAMSVIVARALPDVRDGLKPVHRRILYAMAHDLYLTHDKPHRKSARIVGEVLGKYHPHGDVAVYDAMVRMAQDFSLRYPLIDGQGNFGSIDGDGAAAMRYTEARLAEISTLMLADLDKDTVDWHDNFDNSLQEPDILPAALPNLLVNGASGIAVGMATNIPPHNLGEVVDALVYVIDNYARLEELTVEDLMQFIKGPDFPTGGILYRYREDGKVEEQTDAIAQGYSVGKSRLILQAKAHFEEMSRGRMRIVVTELPYQTNKTALIERIASLTRDGKLEGLTDLRDESDRTGMRIVIELNRNTDPKATLKDLFKYTPLQQTFGLQMLALMDGQPRMLSLKRVLAAFIQHRQEIIRRRSEFDLQRARDRAHIVEGLLRALDILDEVIDTIRRSQNVETARNNLMKNFKFTQIQAQAILDMQLRRLAALERKKLKDEYDELLARIAYLEDLLAHPEKILAVIRADLLEQKEKYGDPRRTQIVDRTKGTLTTTDLLPQQDVWVTVSATGDLRRQDLSRLNVATLRKLGKAGQVAILNANTRDWLYLFSRDGRCTRVAVHEIPQDGNPKHVADLTEFTRRDQITAAITLPRLEGEAALGYLFLATAQGLVKRVTLADFLAPVGGDFTAMAVEEKDRLDWVLITNGQQEVMLVTATGQSIRFSEAEVRSMGLAAGGVGGIKLQKKDLVVYAAVVEAEGSLVTMTARGFAKRTPLSEYSSQGRNGSGIVTHKPTDRTGEVTAALMLPPAIKAEEMLVAVTVKQAVKPITLADIPAMGRGVQGKAVIEELGNDHVATLLRAQEEPEPPGFEGKGGASTLPAAAAESTSPQRATTPSATPAKATGNIRQPATASRAGKGTTPVTTGMTKLKPAPLPAKTPEKTPMRTTAAVTPAPTPAATPAVNLPTASGPVATPPPAADRASRARAPHEASAKATKPPTAAAQTAAPKPVLIQPKPKAEQQQTLTKKTPPVGKQQATAPQGPAITSKPPTTKAAATSPPARQTPRKPVAATAQHEQPTDTAKPIAAKTTSPPATSKRSPQATAALSPGRGAVGVTPEPTSGSTTARRARGKPPVSAPDPGAAEQTASQQEALVPTAVAPSAAATPKPTVPRGTPKRRSTPAPDQPRTLELFPAEQSADAPTTATKGTRKAKDAPASTKPAKMRKLQVAVSVPDKKRK